MVTGVVFFSELIDVLAGILWVAAAAVGWLIVPLIPFLLLLGLFFAARLGVRFAVRAEHKMVDWSRAELQKAASWVQSHV